ncbi:helix-turn-helix transcriptional regulator [Streptosporangium sp. NPDC000396]|uniref:helix-turn-helix domain-containing protein n=1 Tax=Streptosporangium sp. NPDC000396 TaxID=3366185 RepID=UPI00367BAF88
MESPAPPRVYFGTELRRARVAAGMTQKQLSALITVSPSQLSMLENGQREPNPQLAQAADQALGLGTTLTDLLDALNRAVNQLPHWFRPWLEIETEAKTLRMWEPLVLPGLLQTPDYARAVLRGQPGITEKQVEEALETRMRRKVIFNREAPPMCSVVIDETVMHRPIGGHEIMREQLEHLVEAARRPHITVQVVPLSLGATTSLVGGFAIAQLPSGPDVAYMESVSHGQVTNRAEEVQAASLRYDAIRAEAHPWHASVELIEEIAKKTWS